MAIGQSRQRLDAEAKVTGRARYTDDMGLPGMRHAAYVHSTISHGMVRGIDASEALALPGVVAVFTADDVPEFLFPTAGHPYSMDPSKGDVADRLRHLVLPLIVMVASHLWYYAYMIRNKLLDEIRRDYVLLARAKGLGRTRVLLSHCLRNVLPTIVSIMAISIPHVLSGTYVAESVFNYPGIGLLAVSSAKYHDYNLLMLMVLITGAMVMLSSLAAQAVNEVIDPRMKSSNGVVC